MTLNKRPSEDNLEKEYQARADQKDEERKKKDHWARKPIRQRRRILGNLYCCACEDDSPVYEKGEGSVCGVCSHHRCLECIANSEEE